MGYDEADFVPCECCGRPAVDIHHIKARGMGGSQLRDTLENLMALCRACHDKYGDKRQWVTYLIERHQYHMQKKR